MTLLPDKIREKKPKAHGIARLHRDVDDLFRGLECNWDMPFYATRRWPAIDVCEYDGKYIIKVKFPGCRAEDIDLSIKGKTLILSGEKKEEHTDNNNNIYFHSECSFGQFRHELNLAQNFTTDKIETRCENGILKITLPKSEINKTVNVNVRTDSFPPS